MEETRFYYNYNYCILLQNFDLFNRTYDNYYSYVTLNTFINLCEFALQFLWSVYKEFNEFIFIIADYSSIQQSRLLSSFWQT